MIPGAIMSELKRMSAKALVLIALCLIVFLLPRAIAVCRVHFSAQHRLEQHLQSAARRGEPIMLGKLIDDYRPVPAVINGAALITEACEHLDPDLNWSILCYRANAAADTATLDALLKHQRPAIALSQQAARRPHLRRSSLPSTLSEFL